MLVSDVMTTDPLTLPVTASVDDAVALLGSSRISTVPIVDENSAVVGVVSEADVLHEAMPHDPRAHLRPAVDVPASSPGIDEVMTPDPTTVMPTTDCADVAALFVRSGFKSPPVVEGGRLVGVVSRSDLLRVMSQPTAELTRAITTAVDSVGLPQRPFEFMPAT